MIETLLSMLTASYFLTGLMFVLGRRRTENMIVRLHTATGLLLAFTGLSVVVYQIYGPSPAALLSTTLIRLVLVSYITYLFIRS